MWCTSLLMPVACLRLGTCRFRFKLTLLLLGCATRCCSVPHLTSFTQRNNLLMWRPLVHDDVHNANTANKGTEHTMITDSLDVQRTGPVIIAARVF